MADLDEEILRIIAQRGGSEFDESDLPLIQGRVLVQSAYQIYGPLALQNYASARRDTQLPRLTTRHAATNCGVDCLVYHTHVYAEHLRLAMPSSLMVTYKITSAYSLSYSTL